MGATCVGVRRTGAAFGDPRVEVPGVGGRRTGAAFGDPRVEDPGVEGRDTREGARGVCELILTQGTVRATRGGRAAPLY